MLPEELGVCNLLRSNGGTRAPEDSGCRSLAAPCGRVGLHEPTMKLPSCTTWTSWIKLLRSGLQIATSRGGLREVARMNLLT